MEWLRFITPLFDEATDPGEGAGGAAESDAPDGQEEPGEGEQQPPKMLSQDEVNRIVQREKAKAAKAERERLETERRKADMTEAERLKIEKEEAEKRAAVAEERAVTAERRASLTGKVIDPEAAMRLLTDDHLTEDGSIDVDALLKSYPFLTPSNTGTPPTRGSGGGVPRTTLDPNKMSTKEFDELTQRVMRGERVTLGK